MAVASGTKTSVVIFGATGDLTHRKLVPALFNLYLKQRLSGEFNIVGFARRPYTDDSFRIEMRAAVQSALKEGFNADLWEQFADRLWYVQGNLDAQDDYRGLKAKLEELEGAGGNRLYYLATAPEYYEPIAASLGAMDMASQEQGWRRIIVEKPFGTDLASARTLNDAIHQVFEESQIYRIDHYLGKETVQNILFFRFANTIFEPVWNRNYIDHVQITVAEDVEVGTRAGYYDKAGVMRDMFQNHLLQLLCLVAMEPPALFTAEALRNEKVKVLSAIRPVPMSDTVRAQYEGYLETPNVAPESQTPTYAALKLNIDNWRWQGVPFYLRSGKALASKASEIIVAFRCPPLTLFGYRGEECIAQNYLALCIQPDEGIHLNFETKVPDSARETRSVDMEFHYRDSFRGTALPEAYERLLLDALLGDASLFTRSDEIVLAWQLVDHVLLEWKDHNLPPMAKYQRGTMGPDAAEEFLERDGRAWQLECGEHDRD